jgi:hypothetical protein
MKKVSVAAKFSFRCEQYYAVPVNGLLVYNNTVTQQFLLLFKKSCFLIGSLTNSTYNFTAWWIWHPWHEVKKESFCLCVASTLYETTFYFRWIQNKRQTFFIQNVGPYTNISNFIENSFRKQKFSFKARDKTPTNKSFRKEK